MDCGFCDTNKIKSLIDSKIKQYFLCQFQYNTIYLESGIVIQYLR